MTAFDLRSVRLRPGKEHRARVELEIEPVELGGQTYPAVPPTVEADLAVSRASTGWVFSLRLDAALEGPCFRCLEPARVEQSLDLLEYQAEHPGDAEELTTPYLEDGRLDLTAWARDALVLALPDKILCRPDCAGLCPVCGADLNVQPHSHEQQAVDPRWAALEQLREQS